MKKIILASASPRRSELLKSMGFNFDIIPSDIDENIDDNLFSYEIIEKLAVEKAQNIAEQIDYSAIIIGSDTVVVIDNKVLGKPKDKADAENMLKNLSGRIHNVVTAIAIIDSETKKIVVESLTSKVKFRELSETEIKNYVNTNEPMDKAGAYGIQGKASIFVEYIEGCYNNIVGLSTYKLDLMLKEFKIEVL
jgi:septum formation protein